MLLGAFILLFHVLGARGAALRGDFFLFLLSGIMLYMTHIRTFRAVSGAPGPTSGMMNHAPMNTAVSITSEGLGVLYIQLLSVLIALFAYHTLWNPITIVNPMGALGMFLLAIRPWFPDFAGVFTRIYIRVNMIASGKMFVANKLSATTLAMFDWNPLFHAIDQSRGFVFQNYFPHHSSIKYTLYLSIGLLMLGLMGEFYSRKRMSLSWSAKR